jgi:hypothetical protein
MLFLLLDIVLDLTSEEISFLPTPRLAENSVFQEVIDHLRLMVSATIIPFESPTF